MTSTISPPLRLPGGSEPQLDGAGATQEHAAKEFESFLLAQMFSIMRSGTSMVEGPGAEMYGALIDQHVGQALAEGDGIGLAEIFKDPHDDPRGGSLVGTLSGTFRSNSGVPPIATTHEQGTLHGPLSAAAREVADLDGVENQWGRDGRLTVRDLSSRFSTQTASGEEARFAVRDANGFAGYYKCNIFALETARRAGFAVPVIARDRGWGYPSPNGIANDLSDGRVRANWAEIASDRTPDEINAAISRGSGFLLVGDAHTEGASGHMGVIENIRSIERDAAGHIVRLEYDGWEARAEGAEHLAGRTWAVFGHGHDSRLSPRSMHSGDSSDPTPANGETVDTRSTRRGFATISVVQLKRADRAETPTSANATASRLDLHE